MLEADVEVDRRDFTVSASMRVAPGERLALFGPSGAGKTTLLEVIAGMVAPRRARIVLAGRLLTSTESPVCAVPPWQRRVGLLRQDPGLFPHLSVRDNLRYARSSSSSSSSPGEGPGTGGGRGERPRSGRERQSGGDAELARLAAVLGIDGLLAAMPARLSGGQAHRVALGRLLLSRCDALLLDEPYGGLDLNLRRVLTDLVVALVAERGVPAVLVAHELAEAQAFADRLAVLDRGTVLQVGTPDEVVLRPAWRRVAEMVGYTGFVPVPGPAGTVAGIHPERVVIGGHPDRGLVLAGVVTGCRPAGALWETTVRLGDLATGGVRTGGEVCDGEISGGVGAGADRVGGVGADGEISVTGRLPERQVVGNELVLTAIDPPWFGSDGAALVSRATARPGRPAGLGSGPGPGSGSGSGGIRT